MCDKNKCDKLVITCCRECPLYISEWVEALACEHPKLKSYPEEERINENYEKEVLPNCPLKEKSFLISLKEGK